MDININVRIKTKNHAADSEIGFLTKSISTPNACKTAIPTAWELIISIEPKMVSKVYFRFENSESGSRYKIGSEH